MNYTGAGVGNRNGVHVQLFGTVIAVFGMIYAFYVKPFLRRRERDRVLAAARQRAAHATAPAAPPAREPEPAVAFTAADGEENRA